jgi:DnaJ-domain-containing protein 1
VRGSSAEARILGRGELVRLLYRLGRQAASGVLSVATPGSRADVFVLRRGAAVVPDGELARRAAVARLTRLVAHDEVRASFDGGVAAYPPGGANQLALTGWVRAHLEQQLDNSLAERLVRELAGVRLWIRHEVAPEPRDEADRRMLAAMANPRRLDQIWPLARTPRFRLLAFLHFLRSVDALEAEGIVAERSAPHRARVADPRRLAALRLLGVDESADVDTVKRAYRRLARALHPDLQPEADADRKRTLERRFGEVTAAFRDALQLR